MQIEPCKSMLLDNINFRMVSYSRKHGKLDRENKSWIHIMICSKNFNANPGFKPTEEM